MTRSCIIGTAGHIDHGKTLLIKMLTGVDTDRLKEERERGISIELGFASLTTPAGVRCGVIDVPGHERFIRNMLAGAGGIDVILLVIAADEGVMPQTREHLDIVDLLGAHQGVVALTKIDLVDPDWREPRDRRCAQLPVRDMSRRRPARSRLCGHGGGEGRVCSRRSTPRSRRWTSLRAGATPACRSTASSRCRVSARS